MENNHSILGLGFLGVMLILAKMFYTPINQRVFIHPNLFISKNNVYEQKVDTVVADKSRWYYNKKDSTQRNIRISFYQNKTAKPYEVINILEPDDYFDVKIKQGINIVHIDQLGTYPTISKRLLIYKINEVH